MRARKWVRSVLLYFLTIIICIMGVNYIIDPFQIYRKAVFHKTAFENALYLNAGLIKSWDYDSVVIGSSVSENLKIDEIKEKLNFEKPIKLPISGGNVMENYTVLNSAINSKKVKNVLYALDVLFLINLNEKENRLPLYLYDNNFLNNYKYLLSDDILGKSFSFPFVNLEKNPVKFDYNLMYQWQHKFPENSFSKDKFKSINKKGDVGFTKGKDYETITKERIENFNKYVFDVVKNSPEINFIFYYPPYSVFTYKYMEDFNLDSFIKTKLHINKKFKELKNVKLFDFQLSKDIIGNLDNYMDIVHYHQKIDSLILSKIKENENMVLDYDENYTQFLEYIKNYKF